MIIGREFIFDSAHKLDWHKGDCKNLHGHTYKLQILIKGKISSDGIIIDFGDLDKIVKGEILSKLDHQLLNDIIENPTAEKISIWIWEKLSKKVKGLYEVRVWETPKSFAIYRGEDNEDK